MTSLNTIDCTMSLFKNNILSCLNAIKGTGSFVSSHTAPFQFPALEVKDVGEISYPINAAQAEALIKKAHKAPFGKGSKTILDTKVRSAWEIDANDLTFKGSGWADFLKKVLATIKPDLGIEDYSISATLYKMLIYEKGDFFLPHKDSEKEKGMFGTLIIGLPGKHTGGELLLRFDGKEECISFAEDAGNYKIPYVAFYADCEHEIKPITSAYRICLVYNLVQLKSEKKIQLETLSEHVEKLVAVLKENEDDQTTIPKIILLGHQYTPENFSLQGLKLNDRSRAEALLRAADKAGYYAKMCLVTSYLSGMPEPGGGYYGDDVDEDAKMAEVYDDSLYIEHWLNEGPPPLRNIKFEEEDLIATFRLNDDEPILKEVEGYMGNYGPDLMHWYHYGAVLLWPREHHAAMLLELNVANKLEWIHYYNKKKEPLSNSEMVAVETILASDLDGDSYGEKPDYNALADWLINRNDQKYFFDTGGRLLQKHFVKIDMAHLARLADAYPAAFPEKIAALVANNPKTDVVVHLLSLLNVLAEKAGFGKWVALQVKALPQLLSALIESGNGTDTFIKNKTLCDVLDLEKKLPQDEAWVNAMATIITRCRERNYINNVLIAEIIQRKQKTALAHKLLQICREDLQHRVNNKPQPPANWTRELPDTTGYAKQWAILASFLQSPYEEVFDLRKNQHEREALEQAIRGVTIDLKTETIKKGSPHTLRITKTKAAYHRQMKQWNEDVALLEKVNDKLSVFNSFNYN